MKKINKGLKNKENGITLIALVITIIVLLILVGVGISMIAGQNGIITKTQNSKNATNRKSTDEKIKLAIMSAKTKLDTGELNEKKLVEEIEKINGEIIGEEKFPITVKIDSQEVIILKDGEIMEKAKLGEIAENENKIYKDSTGIAVIPKGFAIVTNPSEINSGLVISDKENDDMDNSKLGNQFVWVPVNQENFESTFKRHDYGNNPKDDSKFINTEPSLQKYYEPDILNISGTTKKTGSEVIEMYNSVKKYGGFYVGRYETGNEGEKAVVKKLYEPWMINFCDKNEEGGAIEKARQMYLKHSHLCYGVEWDTIMRWIKEDANLSSYLIDSTGIGNVGTKQRILTGSNDKYQVKNIYDLSGNAPEWTMEIYSSSDNIRILRGGSAITSGTERTISNRVSGNISWNCGFRIAFYI